MTPSRILSCGVAACLFGAVSPALQAADELVSTVVSARTGNGYTRVRQADGSFKPEFYAIGNGGRIAGTGRDITVDRVTYPEVATIAMRLLAGQDYHYAKSADQADLLIVLHWGATIAYDQSNYALGVNSAASSLASLRALQRSATGPSSDSYQSNESAAIQAAKEVFEGEMLKLATQNRARDQINLPNARVLGYLDEINDADGIQRWAGAGDRYNDLVADIEESRYYITISAYDFPELVKNGKKKLLWQTRVSVRAPSNRFDDSVMAMMKSASKYFGQDRSRLIRGEETKGTVEMGDLKFMGEAKESAPDRKSRDEREK